MFSWPSLKTCKRHANIQPANIQSPKLGEYRFSNSSNSGGWMLWTLELLHICTVYWAVGIGTCVFYSPWFYKFDVNFIHTMRELRKQKSTIQHLGSWTLDPGPSIQDPEPWIPDPWSILGPGSRITDPGSRMVDPGSRILGPAWIHHSGSRILDPGSKVFVLYKLFCVFVYIQKMRMRMVNGDRTI